MGFHGYGEERLSVVLGGRVMLFLSPALPAGFSQLFIPLTMTFIFSMLHKDKDLYLLSIHIMKNTDLISKYQARTCL